MIGPEWITQEIEASKKKREQRDALIRELEKAFDEKICQELTLDKMRSGINEIRASVVDDAWNRLSKMLRLVVEKEEWGQVVPLLQRATEFWKQEELRLQELDERLDAICEVEK